MSIYFIQAENGGPIKIGYARNVMDRLTQIQSMCPFKLVLLASARGTLQDERTLHRKFANARLHGEWFSPKQEIIDLYRTFAADGSTRFLSNKTDERPIIEMRKMGMTHAEIGKQFGISRQRVHQICEANGLSAVKEPVDLSEKLLLNIKESALFCGINMHTFRKATLNGSFPVPPLQLTNPPRWNRLHLEKWLRENRVGLKPNRRPSQNMQAGSDKQ